MHFRIRGLQTGCAIPCSLSQRQTDERKAAAGGDKPDRDVSKATKPGIGQQLAKRAILKSEQSAVVWDEAFTTDPPTSDQLLEAVVYLHEKKHYNIAVEGMLSAIRNDQAAPWMYDVLSLEMKLAGRPPKEIARVLESRIDFATSDVPQMLITVAMLSRFEAWDEAISICREAAELNPDFPEVWMLGRSVADKSGHIDAQVWARCGILTYFWGDNHELYHEEARKVLRELAEKCDLENRSGQGELIRNQAAEAESIDLQIALNWVGAADLDLLITEPDGEKCSFKRRITRNRGRLVREEGPSEEDESGKRHSERYVCHSAISGDYEIAVRFVLGKVVTGTAQLEIIQHAGTPRETRVSRTVTLSKDDVRIKVSLEKGRASVSH